MTKITVDKALIEQALSGLLREPLGVDHSAIRQKLRAALAELAVEPVASIYITPDGQREVDDWNVPLPVGRNELYASPPPPAEIDTGLTVSVPLLSSEEMIDAIRSTGYSADAKKYHTVARAIEQVVRQKVGL